MQTLVQRKKLHKGYRNSKVTYKWVDVGWFKADPEDAKDLAVIAHGNRYPFEDFRVAGIRTLLPSKK